MDIHTIIRTKRRPHRMGLIRTMVTFGEVTRARVWLPYEHSFDGYAYSAYEQYWNLDDLEVCHGPLRATPG